MYRVAMAVCRPAVMAWGRLTVEGLDTLPEAGPVLVGSNHDSHWDPVTIGGAAIPRRQIKALAKSTLWDVRGLSPGLNGLGPSPLPRAGASVCPPWCDHGGERKGGERGGAGGQKPGEGKGFHPRGRRRAPGKRPNGSSPPPEAPARGGRFWAPHRADRAAALTGSRRVP